MDYIIAFLHFTNQHYLWLIPNERINYQVSKIKKKKKKEAKEARETTHVFYLGGKNLSAETRIYLSLKVELQRNKKEKHFTTLPDNKKVKQLEMILHVLHTAVCGVNFLLQQYGPTVH